MWLEDPKSIKAVDGSDVAPILPHRLLYCPSAGPVGYFDPVRKIHHFFGLGDVVTEPDSHLAKFVSQQLQPPGTSKSIHMRWMIPEECCTNFLVNSFPLYV